MTYAHAPIASAHGPLIHCLFWSKLKNNITRYSAPFCYKLFIVLVGAQYQHHKLLCPVLLIHCLFWLQLKNNITRYSAPRFCYTFFIVLVGAQELNSLLKIEPSLEELFSFTSTRENASLWKC